ncbi:HRDC domain-containing protein, partial [Candidatus Saccharibacteria bacterium]|nr:HRDC domain-containing protein [Candidatus Saccharibacteria bacterium]
AYVNGTRGTVVDFNGDTPVVVTVDGREVQVEPHSWKLEEDGRVRAEATQLPLRLAWAITIHKSQGMSMDGAEIDLSKSFTPGMGYVALSRVRRMDGVYLTGVNTMALAMHPLIFAYDKELQELSEQLATIVEDFEENTEESDLQAAFDDEVFQRLKTWRAKQARRREIPPYMVAHDTTLKELATRRPQTERALLAVKGMGKMKVDAYGTELLAILKEA